MHMETSESNLVAIGIVVLVVKDLRSLIFFI
jgi:hypothetical protein